MKKTLLLVFIHGFKGGDDTFGNFPTHLRAITSHALPNIEVAVATYPKFETRGDLQACVGNFREWLQNTVIDIEVSNDSAHPTVDPSVHVILIGHSMGGIVGAETIRLLASEQLIPSLNTSKTSSGSDDKAGGDGIEQNTFMFPHIQGLVAFDTPFLGISPGTVSYTAENHYKTASTAFGVLSSVFGGGEKKPENSGPQSGSSRAALPASPSSGTESTSAYQRWGRSAMYAGAGALAVAGAAALSTQRDRFSAGWTWATSHLAFVGCLAQPEDLRRRLRVLAQLHDDRGLSCANIYTRLGQGAVAAPAEATSNGSDGWAVPQPFSISQHILRSKVRTFCNLPQDVEQNVGNEGRSGMEWIEAVNERATDETKAHMTMFLPSENSAFYDMALLARDLLIKWVDRGWYSTAGDQAAESR